MSSTYNQLIKSLKKLPSIGERSASRIAFHLLKMDRKEVHTLMQAIHDFVRKTQHCRICGLISEYNPCRICSSSSRNPHIICIVKNVQDAISLERSHGYRGLYHVLGALISPLEGVDEDDIAIDSLIKRLQKTPITPPMEIILALEQTPEAEATIKVIKRKVLAHSPKVHLSRMAMGMPIGTELEYLDAVTLKSSLDHRRTIH